MSNWSQILPRPAAMAALAIACVLTQAPRAQAEPPPAELLDTLRQYDGKGGDVLTLMKAVVPKLARFVTPREAPREAAA